MRIHPFFGGVLYSEYCTCKLQKFSLSLSLSLSLTQVFKKLQEKTKFKRAIQLSRSAMHRHVDQACRLTWSLVSVSPPLIVCQPPVFREEWQDREYEYWDKGLSSYRLAHTRPVLFQNYEGTVGVKGWVGNKRAVGSSPKMTRMKSSS